MSIKTVSHKRAAKGRWKKGMSGNPAGRPPGSRNQSTVFLEEILHGQGEALIQKGIELSLKGDTRALSICWERLLPPRKERTITLPLPGDTGPKGVSAALASVVTAVAEGSITPSEAECVAHVLETQMRVVEFEVLAERVDKLEKAQTPTSPTSETVDDSTLDWIARNYAKETLDSGTTVEEHPEHEKPRGNQP